MLDLKLEDVHLDPSSTTKDLELEQFPEPLICQVPI